MSKYAVFFTLNKLLHKRADLAVALSWGAVSAGSTFPRGTRGRRIAAQRRVVRDNPDGRGDRNGADQ
jgi:hypothetical protein